MDKVFDELSISLATSDQMRSWSFGEVKKPYVKPKNPTTIKMMEKFLNLFVKVYMLFSNKLFN